MPTTLPEYFPFDIQLAARAKEQLNIVLLLPDRGGAYPAILFYRRLAAAMGREAGGRGVVTAGQLSLYASLLKFYRYLVDELAAGGSEPMLATALQQAGFDPDGPQARQVMHAFTDTFPPDYALDQLDQTRQHHLLLRELLLLNLAAENRALDPLRMLLDDRELAERAPYRPLVTGLEQVLARGPVLPDIGLTLVEALYAPLKASPDSLAGQLEYIREQWMDVLPAQLFEELLIAFDILDEEQRQWSDGGPGPSEVLQFGAPSEAADIRTATYHGAGHHAGYEQPEYEAFSSDADWMSNVVMMAKMTHVWLDQLAKRYSRPITRLDQVPDAELDRLAAWGFTGLWLIGLWERSAASQRIKQLCGNPEAHASAYSLYDYTIAADLGGDAAFQNLKQRAWQRGIRLASDMVPNHTGIYSHWVLEHPDWFIQTEYLPFPTYQFTGEDLSHDPAVTIQIEDGYWTKQDAAVVFRTIDRRDGRTRYIYHGNDGTSIPWNDTAQLNYLLPQVREAVLQTILHVARLTPIIRFDAAMTLAKKHYQRLWFPQRGLGGGIPSRAEHAMSREEFDGVFPQEFWREVVDRMAQEAPDTLLLAEAFWMMEGYFVRTLGMHRVYNSAFMNMLKQEENAKYRQTIKNVLAFNPEVLKRFVNFMNNPDEKTAVEQFGSQGKYFGACILLATMPGLPMFGHGQIEGFHEKYGMEYRKAYWDESVDQGLVQGHELWIFPLLKRRWLFSGSEQFNLFDFCCSDGNVDENVFAYSNRVGDQRALVLYNNRYGATTGWIKTAAPVAQAVEGGEPWLRSSTLAEALELPERDDCYLAFSDLATDLTYLRRTADICSQGLFVELEAYSFHVFLDFRLLEGDSEKDWGRLYHHLAGSGVHSLEEELIQLAYRELIAAFNACLQQLDQPERNMALASLFQQFATLVPAPATLGTTALQDLQVAVAAAHDPAVVRSTVRILRRSGVSRLQLPLHYEQRRTAVALLLVQSLVLPLGSDALSHYGLGRPLARYIAASEAVDLRAAAWQIELCAAVGQALQLWLQPGKEPIHRLFADAEVAFFLLVHDDGGTLWFNKERFGILLFWLALLTAFHTARGAVVPGIPVTMLLSLAEGAGYRVRNLLQLAEASL